MALRICTRVQNILLLIRAYRFPVITYQCKVLGRLMFSSELLKPLTTQFILLKIINKTFNIIITATIYNLDSIIKIVLAALSNMQHIDRVKYFSTILSCNFFFYHITLFVSSSWSRTTFFSRILFFMWH